MVVVGQKWRGAGVWQLSVNIIDMDRLLPHVPGLQRVKRSFFKAV